MDKCRILNHPKMRYSDTEGVPAFFLFCSFLFNWSVPARRGGGLLPLLSRFLRWRKKIRLPLLLFLASCHLLRLAGLCFRRSLHLLRPFLLPPFVFSFFSSSEEGTRTIAVPHIKITRSCSFSFERLPPGFRIRHLFLFFPFRSSPPCGKSLSRGGQKTGVPERGGKKENGQERQEGGGRTTLKKDTKRMRGAS